MLQNYDIINLSIVASTLYLASEREKQHIPMLLTIIVDTFSEVTENTNQNFNAYIWKSMEKKKKKRKLATRHLHSILY